MNHGMNQQKFDLKGKEDFLEPCCVIPGTTSN